MQGSVFNPSSPLAQNIATLMAHTFVLLGAIFALVAFLVFYAIFKYRARPDAADPPPNFGSRKLEIAWTVVPALIVFALTIASLRTMRASDPPVPEDRQPDLVVIGHQWWWEIYYPNSGVVTANEFHVPVGRQLLVRVESVDVIHDFWMPQLGRKIDAIPGHPNHVWMQADAPGVYLGACAEFCGTEHAWMRLRAVAEPAGDFEHWQLQQSTIPAQPNGGMAADGARIFESRTCTNCHMIAGTMAYKRIGPDLTHLSTRQTLGAGVVENSPENLARWLEDPDAFKPGSHMPNLQLSSDEIRGLVAYLESLR